MSIYKHTKEQIYNLGMTYAPEIHQLIWGSFYYELTDLFKNKFDIIQEVKTETARSYRLPDIIVSNGVLPIKPLIFIEISSNENITKAKRQQTDILKNYPNAEFFIYNYDLNEWLFRDKSTTKYIKSSKSNVLNYSLENLYLKSKYKNNIDKHVEEFKTDTDTNSLAGMF